MTTSAWLDNQNRLHRECVNGECPHCGAVSHFSLLACPSFNRVCADRPARIGIVLQCDSCRMPLFFRYRVRGWHEDRVELHPSPEEMEPAPERFNYAHLPEPVANAFREALACYRAQLLQAFAAMCRATTEAMLEDLGERSRLRIFDQVAEVRSMAEIDDGTFAAIRRVLFEGETGRGEQQSLSRVQAAVLLETMKDLLYQTYVRRAKLQQALRLRHFPPEPAAAARSTSTVTTVRPTPRSA
ncbi:MAG: hypothetical protein L6Q83_03745 [Gammaproteobacteria bacterium]|nr:hypothetical protein [Gammaproteobacteria bacterium]